MYYDINDIETEGQRVPTTFNVTVPHLGHIVGNTETIESGTVLELPLWLAGQLSTVQVDNDAETTFVSLEEPAVFSPDVINALKSAPVSLDLAEQSTVFTNLALHWLQMFDFPELANVLYDAVQQRSAEIYDYAVAQRGAQPQFDESERQLYRLVHGVMRNMRAWQAFEQ